MGFKDIVEGTTKATLAKVDLVSKATKALAESRITICEGCPVREGITCSKAKGGCGCIISRKAYCKDCKCPIGRW